MLKPRLPEDFWNRKTEQKTDRFFHRFFLTFLLEDKFSSGKFTKHLYVLPFSRPSEAKGREYNTFINRNDLITKGPPRVSPKFFRDLHRLFLNNN